jgi:hypothetical protein
MVEVLMLCELPIMVFALLRALCAFCGGVLQWSSLAMLALAVAPAGRAFGEWAS